MPLLVTLAEVRDAFIIAYGVAGVFFFAIGTIVALVVGFSVWGLVRAARRLIDESVKPTLESVRDTAKSIQGTTEFVSETAVRPIIRTYGMASGLRRGIGVVTGLARRRKG